MTTEEKTDDVDSLRRELEYAKRANAALPEAEKVILERTRKVEQALGYVPPDVPAEKPDDVVERCAKALADLYKHKWEIVSEAHRYEYTKEAKAVLKAAGFERLREAAKDRDFAIRRAGENYRRAEQAETALAEAGREIEHMKANLAAVLEGEAEAEKERDEWKAKAEGAERERIGLCDELTALGCKSRSIEVERDNHARRAVAEIRHVRELENRIGLLEEARQRDTKDAEAFRDILVAIDELVGIECTEFADLPGIVQKTRDKCEELQQRNAGLEKVVEAADRVAWSTHHSDTGDDWRNIPYHLIEELREALDAAQPKDYSSGEPGSAASAKGNQAESAPSGADFGPSAQPGSSSLPCSAELLARLSRAKSVDIIIRKDSVERRFQADWLKDMARQQLKYSKAALSPDTQAIIAAMYEIALMHPLSRTLNQDGRYAGIDYARRLAERMGER